MNVRHIPKNEGMIFVFPDDENVVRTFWMKDTPAALDMAFVRADGIITELDENVAGSRIGAPESSIARRHGIGRFVIELAAGNAEAAGLEPGTRLRIPNIAPSI